VSVTDLELYCGDVNGNFTAVQSANDRDAAGKWRADLHAFVQRRDTVVVQPRGVIALARRSATTAKCRYVRFAIEISD
jgi:hypothetical protein